MEADDPLVTPKGTAQMPLMKWPVSVILPILVTVIVKGTKHDMLN